MMYRVMVRENGSWFEHGISTEAGWLYETDNIATAKLMLSDALTNHLTVLLVRVIPFTVHQQVAIDV